MRLRPLAAALLPPLCMLAAAPGSALWLSAGELRSHCDTLLNGGERGDATLCGAFIQGFLAGAATAEESAARTVSGLAVPSSEFANRAVRTRIGTRLRTAAQPDLGYCIDASLPPQAVIDRVAAYILRHGSAPHAAAGADEPAAHRLVHDALVAEFPCESD